MSTTIKMVMDPLDDVGLSVSLYDPTIHRVVKKEWVESVKRKLKWDGVLCADKLFVYQHQVLKTMVLAVWVLEPEHSHGKGLMSELGSMGFTDHDRPPYPWFFQVTRPAAETINEVRETRRARQAEIARAEELSRLESEDRGRHHIKHGRENLGKMMTSGVLPFVGKEHAEVLGLETD